MGARARRREARATARRREETEIVLGIRWPRTLYGWGFYLRYWSPLAGWWQRRQWRRAGRPE